MDKDADARLAAARRRAEAALRGETDPQLSRERAAAREELATVPADSPARVTRAFSHVLDDLVTVPGTTIRVGIDPLLSLIPAAGTTVGAAFGAVVLVDAIRLRAPVPVLLRMLGNYVLDWLVGLIPFLGAFFDVAYRSNRKNLRLLQRTISERDQVRRSSLRYWLVLALVGVAIIALVIGVPIALLWGLEQWLTGR